MNQGAISAALSRFGIGGNAFFLLPVAPAETADGGPSGRRSMPPPPTPATDCPRATLARHPNSWCCPRNMLVLLPVTEVPRCEGPPRHATHPGARALHSATRGQRRRHALRRRQLHRYADAACYAPPRRPRHRHDCPHTLYSVATAQPQRIQIRHHPQQAGDQVGGSSCTFACANPDQARLAPMHICTLRRCSANCQQEEIEEKSII